MLESCRFLSLAVVMLYGVGCATSSRSVPTAAAARPAAVAMAVSLSPEKWGDADRFEALQRQVFEPAPLAEGEAGLVASTSGPFAVRAGVEALRQGGSAIDAALTTTLTQVARCAGSWVSYAGILSLLYYEAASGEVHFLEGAFATPRHELEPLSIPARPEPSGRSALVPGFMAAVEAAYERFGRLPFSSLFEPAIWLAEEGFELGPVIAWMIDNKKDVLSRLPATRAIFTRPDGELYQQGDLFRQPALATTLRRVAANGADEMYRGEWGQRFIAALAAEGGKMAIDDLAAYEARWSSPLSISYRDLTLYAPGASMFGGVLLLETFNLLEQAEAVQARHYSESAEAFYWLVRSTRASLLLGRHPEVLLEQFPEWSLDPQSRLGKERSARIWREMQDPAWLDRFLGLASPNALHSDGVVAIDAAGNVAVLTHSINTSLWGTTGLFVDGVSIPDPGSVQQRRIERAGPGARLANPMNPLLAVVDGQPVLAASAIGAGLHEAMIQRAHNVLDFGMNPKEAAEAPVFYTPLWRPKEPGGPPRYEQQGVPAGVFAPEMVDGVRALGQAITEIDAQEAQRLLGYWTALTVDRVSGVRRASATEDGYALAE